ncbi:MAG: glycine zipper family protein [Candidatus Rokuibacteriota bacterium]
MRGVPSNVWRFGRQPRLLLVVALVLSQTGCSTSRPVLYPNAHLESVGRVVADRDIEECESKAKTAGADRRPGRAGELATGTAVGAGVGAAGGAVGGAIRGGAGIGAAIGAATGAVVGLLTGIFRRRPAPSPAYTNFVDRCLREKGYEPTGWQ